MKSKKALLEYVGVAMTHAHRLQAATEKTTTLFPIDAATLKNLRLEEVALLDLMTTRFSKLQDLIGSKIFPLILEVLGEDALTLLDRLNKLEKIGYIDDVRWWMEMRELRNQLTHDYPSTEDVLAIHLNQMVPYIHKLSAYWTILADRINLLLNAIDENS